MSIVGHALIWDVNEWLEKVLKASYISLDVVFLRCLGIKGRKEFEEADIPKARLRSF